MKRAITGGALLGVLALGSAGVVALPLLDRGHGLAAAATPIGSTADQRATAPVARRDLVDRLTQAGTLGYGDRTPLRGAAAGMVTAAPPVGTVLGRGDVAYAIDGRPVYVLTGSVPFWRDLAPGAEGDDVAQLEANLVALSPGLTALRLSMTIIIGLAFFSAIRLSMISPALPWLPQPVSSSPPPCWRYNTG